MDVDGELLDFGLAQAPAPSRHHALFRRADLGGLLLDVGASYLLAAISREMERVGGGISDPARMIAAVGTHHARVGSLVIQRWALPPALSVLVRDHHADSPPAASPLWCAAALGGAVAVHVTGFGDPTGDRELRPASLARCAYTLGVGDTVLRRLNKSLVDSVNQVWAACA
jgi:HD-like signal output (HDOD) protein